MPAKLLGVVLVLGGLWLRHSIRRARQRGYVGPRYRRVHRDAEKWKFEFALGSQAVGALICFISAFLCFTSGLHQ